MLKYLTKFAMDILPSVVATIIGAYIVNHYIAAKPDTPAAVVSSADPKQTDAKTDPKATVKASVSVVGGLPRPGVTAKGISEKAMIEQTAAEKPAVVEKPVAAEKPAEKSADKPAETASIPADIRRHAPAPREREKVIAKSVAAPATSVAAPTASGCGCRPRRRRARCRRARRGRGRFGGSPRRQRTGARGHRAVAWRRFAAPAGSRPWHRSAPNRIGAAANCNCTCGVGPGGSAAAASDHGLHPGGRELQRAGGIHAGWHLWP